MNAPELEFSRPIKVSEMGKAGLEFSMDANADECAALARRLDVVEMKSLTAEVRVQHWRKGGAHLKAQIKGSMVRTCVVTLEDFEQSFEDTVDIQFADPRDKILKPPQDDGEVILDAEGQDPPEMVEKDEIDAGETIVLHLILTLDAYPRKPGVEFAEFGQKEGEPSPFAVLADLDLASDKDTGKD